MKEPKWQKNPGTGECPVPAGHDVELKLRDGDKFRTTDHRLGRWEITNQPDDIVEYRDWTDFKHEQFEKGHANSDKTASPSITCRQDLAALTLSAALGHMEDRAATYDSEQGERSMGKTVAMFNSLYEQELTEEQGWAFMCLLKLVRTSQGDFRADNYEDLAAYAGLMRESADGGE